MQFFWGSNSKNLNGSHFPREGLHGQMVLKKVVTSRSAATAKNEATAISLKCNPPFFKYLLIRFPPSFSSSSLRGYRIILARTEFPVFPVSPDFKNPPAVFRILAQIPSPCHHQELECRSPINADPFSPLLPPLQLFIVLRRRGCSGASRSGGNAVQQHQITSTSSRRLLLRRLLPVSHPITDQTAGKRCHLWRQDPDGKRRTNSPSRSSLPSPITSRKRTSWAKADSGKCTKDVFGQERRASLYLLRTSEFRCLLSFILFFSSSARRRQAAKSTRVAGGERVPNGNSLPGPRGTP